MPQPLRIPALGRLLVFCLFLGGGGSALLGQFVVERSPWLDGDIVTEEPVSQTWHVADGQTQAPIQAEFTVEGINPRKPVRFLIEQDTTLQLAPFRRYGRLCVEPNYMLYSDYIYADPTVPSDTVQLTPLSVGCEAALPAIEFMPGTEHLYFTSIPALEALQKFIEINPTVAVAIVGHDGADGNDAAALMTSRNRARAVFEYLVSSGVEPNRLSVEGRGTEMLLHPHPKTPEEAEANRRITVRVTNY